MIWKVFILFIILNLVVSKDLYNLLGLSKKATTRDIKNAYRRLAKKYHPDKQPKDADEKTRNAASEKFIEITDAYEILKDPKKRSDYDRFGVLPGQQNQQGHQYGQQFFRRSGGSTFHFGSRGNRGGSFFESFTQNSRSGSSSGGFSDIINISEDSYRKLLSKNNFFHTEHSVNVILHYRQRQFFFNDNRFYKLFAQVNEKFSHDDLVHVYKKLSSSYLLEVVINDVVFSYSYDKLKRMNVRDIESFVLSSFDSVIGTEKIHVLSTEKDVINFMNYSAVTASEGKKIPMILFSKRKKITLLEKEASYLYGDFIHFGHCVISSTKESQIEKDLIEKKFDISLKVVPSLLYMKDDHEFLFVKNVNKKKLYSAFGDAFQSLGMLYYEKKNIHQFYKFCKGIICVLYFQKERSEHNIHESNINVLKKFQSERNIKVVVMNEIFFKSVKNSASEWYVMVLDKSLEKYSVYEDNLRGGGGKGVVLEEKYLNEWINDDNFDVFVSYEELHFVKKDVFPWYVVYVILGVLGVIILRKTSLWDFMFKHPFLMLFLMLLIQFIVLLFYLIVKMWKVLNENIVFEFG